MKEPPRFVDPSCPFYDCRLDKALYGLKQAPWAWYSRLSDKMQFMGFLPSQVDVSLFHHHNGSVTMFLLVYVDDIIVASFSPTTITALMRDLKDDFTLKDLGPLHYFLGIKVHRIAHGIHLSQAKYTTYILIRACMFSCKGVSTPLPSNSKLSVQDSEPLGPEDTTKYRSMVGALQYLTLTLSDISFSVNKVCQFLHSPTTAHLTAVKCILQFLKHTIHFGLHIRCSPSTMVCAFYNADWAGCSDDHKSIGGFVVFLGPNLVSWCAKKQKMVSHTSTEGEYKAMADVTTEVMWVQTIPHNAQLWCDNMRAKYLALNPIFHGHMKHVEVDYHFVRD
jgi:hypothetical protein